MGKEITLEYFLSEDQKTMDSFKQAVNDSWERVMKSQDVQKYMKESGTLDIIKQAMELTNTGNKIRSQNQKTEDQKTEDQKTEDLKTEVQKTEDMIGPVLLDRVYRGPLDFFSNDESYNNAYDCLN